MSIMISFMVGMFYFFANNLKSDVEVLVTGVNQLVDDKINTRLKLHTQQPHTGAVTHREFDQLKDHIDSINSKTDEIYSFLVQSNR